MEIFASLGLALWLGILTSISPCPLATNIAAVSFISKKITHPVMVFIAGLAYTFGRMLTYAILGWLLINSILGIPVVAQFLQKYMLKALGPILFLTGLFLLEIIRFNLPTISLSQDYQNKLVSSGALGSFVLGVVFALAFCPVSAALFFGSLIPLALEYKIGFLFPFIYGIGTGLPVLIFAIALAFGVKSLSCIFKKIVVIEYYTRKVTGIIFVVIGLYYSVICIFKLFS